MHRRSILIRGSTYIRLKRLAASQRRSVSGVLEEIVKTSLDDIGIPEDDEDYPSRSREKDISEIIDRHFTF